ncbi:hemerythrin domain-containing protein [Achromobacter aloeverae]|nr:hemerythrin domain-containing protein [Achromobacter aloeverae]
MDKAEIPLAQRDALGLMLDDHCKIKHLFKAFSREKDAEAREAIAHEACLTLTLIGQIEEELFYPYVRMRNEAAFGHLIDKALVEHSCIRGLIAQIQGMTSEDRLFHAKVTVLGELASHHVSGEEGELYPKLMVMNEDLRDIGARMRQRKDEITIEAHIA